MKSGKAGLMVILWVTGVVQIQAEVLRLESAGARGGTSDVGDRARFYQAENYVNWNLPWRWDWKSGWHLQTRLDLTAGWINGRGEDAVVGTLGPSLELSWDQIPLTLDAGSRPTLLSREQFGNTDFGTVFQFTTHAGLTWKTGKHLSIGCRFQHMSNANIGPSNPGLNLYLIGVGWRF